MESLLTSSFKNLYKKHLNITNYHESNDDYKNSLKTWLPHRGLTGDAENLNTKNTLNRAWDLFNNNPTTRSIVTASANGVIGTGLKVGPNIDFETLGIDKKKAKELNSKLARLFNLWASSECSCVDRKTNFNMLQMRLFMNYWVSGDCFALIRNNRNISKRSFPFDLSIQGIDSDMVANPMGAPNTNEIAGGIRVNEYGEEISYFFKVLSDNIVFDTSTDSVEVPKFGKSGRRNVLHIHVPVRFRERRGISLLSPVMEALKQLDRFDASELMATVLSSFFTAFVKTPDVENGLEGLSESVLLDQPRYKNRESDLEMGPGMITTLEPGEDVIIADPKRPSKSFKEFEDVFLTKVSSYAGLPVEMVNRKYESSYTAARAALLQAYHQFKIDRQNFAFTCTQLVYEEFVDEIVLKNLIELPGYLLNPLNKMAYLRCNWVGDSMGLIDPVKEITAAKMARQEQIKTSDDISREMTGRSYQENLDVLDDENQERKNKDMLFPDEYDRQTKRLAVEKQGEKIDG